MGLVDQLYESDPGEVPACPDVRLTFAEFERRPEKGTIIAFDQRGKLVGYAILVNFWSNEFRGDIIEIDELLIEQEYRGQGIATEFFRWLESAERNCVGYALQVSPSNQAAIELYRKSGFVTSHNQYFVKLRSGR